MTVLYLAGCWYPACYIRYLLYKTTARNLLLCQWRADVSGHSLHFATNIMFGITVFWAAKAWDLIVTFRRNLLLPSSVHKLFAKRGTDILKGKIRRRSLWIVANDLTGIRPKKTAIYRTIMQSDRRVFRCTQHLRYPEVSADQSEMRSASEHARAVRHKPSVAICWSDLICYDSRCFCSLAALKQTEQCEMFCYFAVTACESDLIFAWRIFRNIHPLL